MTALFQRSNLLLRHREGDKAAFALLVEEYRATVYSYLVRCGVRAGDRDDLFQEIFIKIHRARANYRPELPLHPWLFTIVANTVRHHLRRARVREILFAEAALHRDAAVDAQTEQRSAARERLSWLEGQLRLLPLVQREVLLLIAVENLSHGDAARALGISVQAVKAHLRRARVNLAAKLAALDRGKEIR